MQGQVATWIHHTQHSHQAEHRQDQPGGAKVEALWDGGPLAGQDSLPKTHIEDLHGSSYRKHTKKVPKIKTAHQVWPTGSHKPVGKKAQESPAGELGVGSCLQGAWDTPFPQTRTHVLGRKLSESPVSRSELEPQSR